MNVMAAALRPRTPSPRLAGTVLPVHTAEDDNLVIHSTLDDALPGDVLVINAGQHTDRAVFGNILGGLCLAKGVTGIVIDGSTRDVDELTARDLTVYARGIAPVGPYKNGPGRIGFPIACGNTVRDPGDAIIGDNDGLTVVPRGDTRTVLQRVQDREREEHKMREAIRAL